MNNILQTIRAFLIEKSIGVRIKSRLFLFLGTGLILTSLLGSIVYGRVMILTQGHEILLKTVPVDPRDLFRGYFVRLAYDISRLNSCKMSLPEKVKRNQTVYVALQPVAWGKEWKVVAVNLNRRGGLPKDAVIVQGRARYSFKAGQPHCQMLHLNYGIEKYFVPKYRAQELEKMQRGNRTATLEINQKIREKQRALTQKIRRLVKEEKDVADDTEVIALREQLAKLRKERRIALESTRKKISVMARVSPTGEIAISGLKIDGKKLYEEPLF